jgi:hypothetical protein
MDDQIEIIARAIAAGRIALIKDKFGEKLPDDLWRQAIPHAERVIEALKWNDLVIGDRYKYD